MDEDLRKMITDSGYDIAEIERVGALIIDLLDKKNIPSPLGVVSMYYISARITQILTNHTAPLKFVNVEFEKK